jgi:hypothetical protein
MGLIQRFGSRDDAAATKEQGRLLASISKERPQRDDAPKCEEAPEAPDSGASRAVKLAALLVFAVVFVGLTFYVRFKPPTCEEMTALHGPPWATVLGGCPWDPTKIPSS